MNKHVEVLSKKYLGQLCSHYWETQGSDGMCQVVTTKCKACGVKEKDFIEALTYAIECIKHPKYVLESNKELQELRKELDWWHNLIDKHHDNETCPNLKTYVESLQALKNRVDEGRSKKPTTKEEVMSKTLRSVLEELVVNVTDKRYVKDGCGHKHLDQAEKEVKAIYESKTPSVEEIRKIIKTQLSLGIDYDGVAEAIHKLIKDKLTS